MEAKSDTLDALALNDALDRLAALEERQARVVELRYFAGLSVDDTAATLGVSPATVKRDWTIARVSASGAARVVDARVANAEGW